MTTRLLLILLGASIILPSRTLAFGIRNGRQLPPRFLWNRRAELLKRRIEGPHAESEKGPSSSLDDVYGPKPQASPQKLPAEEIKPIAIDTPRRFENLLAATQILDGMLNNYDNRLRPGIGEKPTVVTVVLSVNTLGPISVPNMEYSIDITLCQTWYDERLRYNGSLESFVLSGDMVSQLWIPDTFFRNSKRIHNYGVTRLNQMVRIHKDGKVLYTDRMIIDARCSLHMFKFPMDSHSCPLSFSSFSYPENEIIYKWDDFKLDINDGNSWKLLQFDFTGVSNETKTISTTAGDFMVTTLFFNVSRRFGFNIFQSYVPSSVTTIISWVSFWIKSDFAQARTSLGITSILTITTLSSFSQKNFPRVSCMTALDLYTSVCFILCIIALLEFALLSFLVYHYMKSHTSPRVFHPRTRVRALTSLRARAHTRARQQHEVVCEIEDSEEDSDEEEGPSCPAQRSLHPGRTRYHSNHCRLCKYLCMARGCKGSFWQQGRLFIHIYRLDNYSRVIFPLTFFFFNVVYWLVCLNF